MAETIDIYDANLTPIGTMDRMEAHLTGQWHRTFHCWVVNGNPPARILFQVRSAQMANFPNMLDVSAAGHLEAGETIAQGVREVEEELGVDFSSDALEFLGDRVEVADQVNGQRNREYQAVYMLRLDQELGSYEPQVEEVSALVWLSIDDGLQIFSGNKDAVTVHGVAYEDRGWVDLERTVTATEFLPRIQRYYLTACVMADRLIRGERPLAIS